ncbi:MAG: SLBB domain-containing protein [Terriglobales bacterium]
MIYKLRIALLSCAVSWAGLGILCPPACAQQDVNASRQDSDRMDREERALVDRVTLAPEQIATVLRQQPLVMLEVKKDLVRKAYEQGRLLDPADLTDSVVLQLVDEDKNVQVIATREIERQLSLRRAANDSGMRRQRTMQQAAATEDDNPSAALPRRARPEPDVQEYIDNPLSHPGQLPPAAPPTAPSENSSPQRQVQRASVDRDVPDVLDSGSTAMTRVSPAEMPSLLQQSLGLSPASLKMGGSSSMGMSGMPDLSEPLDLPTSPSDDMLNNAPSPTVPRQKPAAPTAASSTSMDSSMAIHHRPNPYADVPSLYDIYSQVSKQQPRLERFATSVFHDGTGNVEDLPMDLPVGPEYVLGPGDGLNIQLSGGVSQRLIRNVDREGRIALPEVGAVLVAGKSMGQVQHDVQAALRTQFRYIQADVSLSRLRTVRVYVVGDVQRPGGYDISALSTPLNALYAAGGPTQNGSLRVVKHMRGKELVQQVDLYDLLLNGTRNELKPLQPGDTILVPPIGPQVKVQGMVRRPAIYELNGEQDLAQVLQLAGGVLATGTLRHIDVERVQAHTSRSMLSLDIPETNDAQKVTAALEQFKVQDGDAIQISPILPYSEKTVYLDGHVFRPGKYPYRTGMKVTDVIRSYDDLLPEPYTKHAEIIRLSQPDFRPMVIPFNLADALSQPDQDFTLQPFDTVRVFGRFDFEDPPTVTVNGEVREPGMHHTNGGTRLSDAIYLAGGITPDAKLDDAQIIRATPDGKVRVMSANLALALKGDLAEDVLLQSKDRVIVHRSMAKLDPPSVTIQGEVARPGRYPLGADMSATDLVRMAGGLKRSAYKETADLSRYMIEDGKRVLGDHQDVPIGRALAGEPDTDVRLRDGDVLTIGQIGGWNEIGASIKVNGEVAHPGVYGIQEGERLSSVLKRAGGFRGDAYPYGAALVRVQVRELAEKNREQLIRRIEAGSDLKASPEVAAQLPAALQQQQQVLLALKSQPANGRMVIHISSDISKWEGTVNDIVVRNGDELTIPKQPYFVMVNGQVYNGSAVTYQPGKNAEWYLRQAGGPTQLADMKNIFVVRADGSVYGRNSGGMWGASVKGEKLRPGDTVIVPEKFFTPSSTFKTVLQTAQVLSQIAFTAAVATR